MEKNEELSFSGTDPGAVKYGNFINYYSFHSPDARISNLNKKMFPHMPDECVELTCLDIGCNTGELTKALKNYLQTLFPKLKFKIFAIDIDNTLIERAREVNTDDDIEFMAVDIMADSGVDSIRKYLENNNKLNFDIIFCFSVTMWIHLNHGDDGLIKFLELLKSITRLIIIEPQPWKCYRSAQRRLKKSGRSFELYGTLKIKNSLNYRIEKSFTEDGFIKVYESAESMWQRKVQSYCLLRLLNPN